LAPEPRKADVSLGVGDRLGPYEIRELLGSGAQAHVFLATDRRLGRRAAIKLFPAEQGPSVGLREARLIASLEHPNIVRVYQVERTAERWYIAMEYLEGGSAADLLERGELDRPTTLRLAQQAASALEYAHQEGVVHRDIKPHNLLLAQDGTLKLSDFGLARQARDLRSAKRPEGTPLFMAPEVWGGGRAGARADVYSLGACLYYLLTGGPPFRAPKLSELARLHIEEPPPPSDRLGNCEELVMACMAKDPGRRPTAAEVARQLRRRLNLAGVHPTDQPSPGILADNRLRGLEALARIETFQEGRRALLEAIVARRPLLLASSPYAFSLQLLVQSCFEDAEAPVLVAQMRADGSTDLGQRLDEIEPDASEGVARGVHLHLGRGLSPAEADRFFKLVEHESISAVVTGNAAAVDAVRTSAELSGREALFTRVVLPAMSQTERRDFVLRWARAMQSKIVLLTPKADTLLARTEATGCFERCVHNAVLISERAGLRAVTTWSVWGGAAHEQWIGGDDDILAGWQQRPSKWPDPVALRRLLHRSPLPGELASAMGGAA